jgi:hypothetical protein
MRTNSVKAYIRSNQSDLWSFFEFHICFINVIELLFCASDEYINMQILVLANCPYLHLISHLNQSVYISKFLTQIAC